MINKVISWGGRVLFWFFFFVVMVDPTSSILHLKDVMFVLLVAYCMVFYKPDLSKLPYILMMVCAVAIPYLLSVMAMTPIDDKEALAVFKSIAPSLLLLWVRNFNLVKIARGPVVICCVAITIIYIVCIQNPVLEELIWRFMIDNNDTVMISRRSILGFEIFGFYLKSCVCFLFVLAYYIVSLLDKSQRNILNILCLAFMIFAFLVSGTRSTMLVPFFLLIVTSFRIFRDLKYLKYTMIPVTFLLAMVFIVVVIVAASETTEASNVVKYAHLNSYINLFYEHPLYPIIGQGPGTSFWSDGFNSMTYKTEWTYLELIRCFGLFSIIIVYIFAKPLINFWKYRNKDVYTFSAFFAYLAYMLIAGTNPLLLSSTGMVMLMMAYSYEDNLLNEQEMSMEVM